jgi:RimJ/RimL family protein N-acetyltransferase
MPPPPVCRPEAAPSRAADPSEIEIATERLLIREVRVSDVDAFHAYMQRPVYWRHLPVEPPDRAWVEGLVGRCLRERSRQPRAAYLLAVSLRTTGEVVGEAGLRVTSRRPRHGEGEVGWGVAAPHAGRGLATEIGRALLDFGFGGLGLRRIHARCAAVNAASQRVMAKLGMAPEEGVLGEHRWARGEEWSMVRYAASANDARRVVTQATRPIRRG